LIYDTVVLKALQKQHASSRRNLMFGSEDTYAMQAVFDPKWESGVPYTVLLSPEGLVLYQEQGEVDMLKLCCTIIANLPDPGYIGHCAYWNTK
jgi:hypothetical protein